MINSKNKIKFNDILNGQNKFMLFEGDSLEILKSLPDGSVHCAITSPPYWKQRMYHHEKGINFIPLGDESNYSEYISNLLTIFSELKRVLTRDGSFWLNIGDKYLNKNLLGLPWRVAIAMQEDGWILRNDIIWDQMKGTQSAKDRFRDIYEHIFHFVKNKKYYYSHNEIRIQPTVRAKNLNGIMISATGVSGKKYYNQIRTSTYLSRDEKLEATKALDETIEEMRNGEVIDFRMTIRGNQRTYHSENEKISGRAKELLTKGFYILKMRSKGYLPSDIWRIVPEDKWRKDTHYAVFPEDLLINPILATCPPNGIVIDPFSGTGSTIVAAIKLKRKGIGIELSSEYNKIAKERINEVVQNNASLLPFE